MFRAQQLSLSRNSLALSLLSVTASPQQPAFSHTRTHRNTHVCACWGRVFHSNNSLLATCRYMGCKQLSGFKENVMWRIRHGAAVDCGVDCVRFHYKNYPQTVSLPVICFDPKSKVSPSAPFTQSLSGHYCVIRRHWPLRGRVSIQRTLLIMANKRAKWPTCQPASTTPDHQHPPLHRGLERHGCPGPLYGHELLFSASHLEWLYIL